MLTFSPDLVPGAHYQLCEDVMPGWNTNLGPNLFVPASMTPPSWPNPNVNNMTVCTDFVARPGQTTTFTVNKSPPPGGRALTIGFWKNWASCAGSNGHQKNVLDQTLAKATSMTTDPPGGLVVSAQNPGGGWPNVAPVQRKQLHPDLPDRSRQDKGELPSHPTGQLQQRPGGERLPAEATAARRDPTMSGPSRHTPRGRRLRPVRARCVASAAAHRISADRRPRANTSPRRP